MWKVDRYQNTIREVTSENGTSSDKFFPTEREALKFIFERSAAAMEKLNKEAEAARLRHNRLCKKFGRRLRSLCFEDQANAAVTREREADAVGASERGQVTR